jgi:hypothetical protein
LNSNSTLLRCIVAGSFFLYLNCKKNNVNNPPGKGTKSGCLISTKTVFSPTTPGYIERDSIEYNSNMLFVGYHRGGLNHGVFSVSDHYEIKYTPQGKIDSIIYFQGSHIGGIYRIFYNNNFVSAVIAVTGPPDTANFSWNTHGQNELDAVTYGMHSGCIVSSQTLFFNYQAASASTLDVQVETGTSCTVRGQVEDLYTVFSTNPQSGEIKSPFRDSTTHEQQFLYYYFRVMDPLISLSTNWPLAVFEGYSYASGQKIPGAHFYYNYVTDNNRRVTSVAYYTATDNPGFSHFFLYDSTAISYLCR